MKNSGLSRLNPVGIVVGAGVGTAIGISNGAAIGIGVGVALVVTFSLAWRRKD